MKTTLEIPDELFRATKAQAAHRGESLKKYVCDALQARLEQELASVRKQQPGWRRVFGRARSDEVREIDVLLEGEFDQVELDEWK